MPREIRTPLLVLVLLVLLVGLAVYFTFPEAEDGLIIEGDPEATTVIVDEAPKLEFTEEEDLSEFTVEFDPEVFELIKVEIEEDELLE